MGGKPSKEMALLNCLSCGNTGLFVEAFSCTEPSVAVTMAARVAARNSLLRLTSTCRRGNIQPQNTQYLSTKAIFNGPCHPRISQQSQYRREISLANLFRRYGFPPSQLHNFLSKNRFFLNFDLQELEKCLVILLSFSIPQQSLISLIFDCPGVLEYQFLKKWEVGFSELKGLATSPLMIKNFLEYSRRFELHPQEVSKSVEILRGLGFADSAIARALEKFPTVVLLNEGDLLSIIEFFKELGIPRNETDRILSLYPSILGLGVEDRLKSLLRELTNSGFSNREIRKEVVREPRILGMELGEFPRCLQWLKTLKCRVAIKDKIFAEGELRAVFAVKLRVDCLCSHGLIRRDAFKVLWKEPRLITYDIENIEKKIEYLVQRMNYSVECLPEVPEYLGVNFEKQIVPRHHVMEYLKAKGAIDFEVGLKDLIKPTRLRFYNLYVKPYPECEKIYGRFSGNIQVKKSKHPAGLWKLLRPQKFSQTKEDVKNMKSFMDSL